MLFFNGGRAFAQVPLPKMPVIYNGSSNVLNDSVVKKRFGRAAGELLTAELVPWIFDRYVTNVDYARISWKTVGHNIKPSSWTWDNDPFQTNQFGHPYHGSMFYSAFRSNGYSFWQSVPATMAGSYLWETFAENQAPAPNDFINTSFGGIVLGEMTYRFSNKIINNRQRGFKRQFREVLGFLVNPMNGLNRLLDGKWGKVYGNPKERDSTHISAEFDLGLRNVNSSGSKNLPVGGPFGWYGRARLLYGDPIENLKSPFSNIIVTAEFGQDDSTNVNVISVYGSLAGWDISNKDNIKNLLILSANYDYIHNRAFFYGGQSVKLNMLSEFRLNSQLKINTAFGAGPILLAAIPDPYLFKGRNYDYGPGFAINGGGTISLFNRIFYGVNYRGGWVITVNGNRSHYFLHTVSSELSFMIIKGLSICAEPGYFRLEGNYKNHADVDNTYPYLRFSTRYSINF
ncbi:DUF3943 domain-containing protein [Mucilaginibacter pocheonensis]|uniref:DUF3943 domain-containing protein n=1 Tax=Mucilaginibacter pocheonensis TaxID=398050 RepID=A0ABU1T7L8_9SPHI|nr:DUF3943 domain-containing protein [Mucilaginibacter pocheonensis]MDR6941210.1 hypothetical protein [Mucilaginibacter pocheonensis]